MPSAPPTRAGMESPFRTRDGPPIPGRNGHQMMPPPPALDHVRGPKSDLSTTTPFVTRVTLSFGAFGAVDFWGK